MDVLCFLSGETTSAVLFAKLCPFFPQITSHIPCYFSSSLCSSDATSLTLPNTQIIDLSQLAWQIANNSDGNKCSPILCLCMACTTTCAQVVRWGEVRHPFGDVAINGVWLLYFTVPPSSGSGLSRCFTIPLHRTRCRMCSLMLNDKQVCLV